MSEIARIPQTPPIPQFERERPLTVMETRLGGEKKGGEFSFSLLSEALPPPEGRDSFYIDNLKADLIAVVKPAGELGMNTFGIVRAKKVGNNSGEDNILFVKLVGSKQEGYHVVEDEQTKRPAEVEIPFEDELFIGRDEKRISPKVAQLKPQVDRSMSAQHLSIKRNGEQITVLDRGSTNGTTIETMGRPEQYTEQEIQEDMKDLLLETRNNRMRKQTLGSVALDFVQGEEGNTPETAKEKRVSELFGAYNGPVASSGDFDYDKLYDPEYEYPNRDRQFTREDLIREGLEKRFTVTEESLRSAEPHFRGVTSRDPVIAQTIREFKETRGVWGEKEVMAALRTDSALRQAVGRRIMERVEANPYAVGATENKKTPTHPGYSHYENLTGREYVALLVMSMIDGTFKESEAKSTPIIHSKVMQTDDGRSREAALAVLREIQR